MSVINKMLRDLDERQAVGVSQGRASAPGLGQGTRVVSAQGRRLRPARVWVALALAASLVLGALVLQGQWPIPAPASAPPAPPLVAPTGESSAPAAAASVATAAVKAAPPMAPASALPKPPPALPTTVVQPPMRSPVPAGSNLTLRLDNTLVHEPHAATAPVAPPLPPAAPQRSAALDALAQAQSLWTTGSRSAAIDLLNEALALFERTQAGRPLAGDGAVLASLAREIARMELASGRVSQALDLLVRLEPGLAEVADIWALRGNAAQRLGRHQESASAYLMALKLRPDEPRWMLGAAVSLAAQGRIIEAAEWADKAQAAGGISPEVASYLRQLGVIVK